MDKYGNMLVNKYGLPIYYGPENPCPRPVCPTCRPKPKPEKKKK